MNLIQWIQGIIPENPDFVFVEYVMGYVLLFAMVCIILSMFCSVISALFHR